MATDDLIYKGGWQHANTILQKLEGPIGNGVYVSEEQGYTGVIMLHVKSGCQHWSIGGTGDWKYEEQDMQAKLKGIWQADKPLKSRWTGEEADLAEMAAEYVRRTAYDAIKSLPFELKTDE